MDSDPDNKDLANFVVAGRPAITFSARATKVG